MFNWVLNLDHFLIFALLCAAGIALCSGILGVFVVCKRMALFSDSIGHSSVLGVTLGVFYGLNLELSIVLVAFAFGFFLLFLHHNPKISLDSLLSILSSAALSLGLVVASLMPDLQIDLHGFLFGDILSINKQDLWWILGVNILVLGVVFFNWQSFLLIALHEDLAKAEGENIFLKNAIFMLLITLLVGIGLKMVGTLLMASLLIIPPNIARIFSKNMLQMIFFTPPIGILGSVIGILGSYFYDTPSGPSIVLALAGFFLCSRLFFKMH